ncbi:hypothetical protein [Flavobacterium sp.]|uniref:hypothetical protein n=1 Tax=Flavobacterium sp. TaxID=239 RepID=UPI00122BE723|nr:hypothetical protein [Flavobacterium sp.]RZJ72271.1 MAG: hypothetical protein EOO49_07410 [Flavobacterium sp.]
MASNQPFGKQKQSALLNLMYLMVQIFTADFLPRIHGHSLQIWTIENVAFCRRLNKSAIFLVNRFAARMDTESPQFASLYFFAASQRPEEAREAALKIGLENEDLQLQPEFAAQIINY